MCWEFPNARSACQPLHRALLCDIIYLARKLSTAMLAQRISSALTMTWPRHSTHVQLCMKDLSRVVGFYVRYFASLPFIPLCLLFFWILCFEGVSLPPHPGPYPWRCSPVFSPDIHSFPSLVSISSPTIHFPSLLSLLWIPSLISNFHRVLNVLCFLLGNSPAFEFYIPTFRNTLFHLHRQVGSCLWRWNSERALQIKRVLQHTVQVRSHSFCFLR